MSDVATLPFILVSLGLYYLPRINFCLVKYFKFGPEIGVFSLLYVFKIRSVQTAF